MKLGGYPRLWFPDGQRVDILRKIAPEDSEEYERKWKAAGVLVEWLLSPRGRLDRALPQTLPRLAHNGYVRRLIERKRTSR